MESVGQFSSAQASMASGRRLFLASLAGGLVLGGVLLLAAWGKALDPAAFAREIRTQGPGWLGAWEPAARILGWLLIGLEAGLGLALVLGQRSRPTLVLATSLVGLFVFLTARTYSRFLRGVPIDAEACGCFGNLFERTPGEAFWQDLSLLVPPLALCWLGRSTGDRSHRKGRFAAVAGGVLGVVATGFAALSLQLPLDDVATRARPGVAIADLCAGAGRDRVCLDLLLPQLATGGHWLVLADFDDPGFATRDTPAVNAYVAAHPQESILVAASATLDEQNAFFWKAAPNFEIHDVPAGLLGSLYRVAPRSLRVEDGRIVATRRGLPD